MDLPKDDGFKWFGEGFDGFPRRLLENSMEYTVHMIVNDAATPTLREKLEAFRSAAADLETALFEGYIWQREGPHLEIVDNDGCVKALSLSTTELH